MEDELRNVALPIRRVAETNERRGPAITDAVHAYCLTLPMRISFRS